MLRQKTIAWILLAVFYLELCGQLYAGVHSSGFAAYMTVSSGNSNTASAGKVTDESEVRKPMYDLAAPAADNQFYTGGPSQPEMASFKSVGADNMVNLFTGDFSYSIPLMDVGGYPINMFYSGGIGMEQEASWVGLGWNINPGSINRNMRGLPDDFDGSLGKDMITKTQSIKPDKTIGLSVPLGTKVLGMGKASFTAGIFHNNYKGLGLEVGGSFNIFRGIAKKSADEKTAAGADTVVNYTSAGINMGASFNLNSQEGMSLNPKLSLSLFKKDKGEPYNNLDVSIGTSYNSRSGYTGLLIAAEEQKTKYHTKEKNPGSGSPFPMEVPISFAKPSYVPTIRMPITRRNFSGDFKFGKEFFGANPYISLRGYYTESRIDEKDKVQVKPAFGFLYMDKGNDNRKALLDFNRINDNVYTPKTPVASAAYYTYDVFSINGEGTGGSFRAYRGNIGYVRDPYTQTRSDNAPISVELGVGNALHVGAEVNFVTSTNTVFAWSSNNTAEKALRFKSSDADRQMVYFKNPGEKAIVSEDYFNAIGGDKLVRLKLINPGSNKPVATPFFETFGTERNKIADVSVENSFKNSRDKRTQVISFLTAEEATRVGLDKTIRSYPMNNFNVVQCENYRIINRVSDRATHNDDYRMPNHISEISVLESDGKRYIYGIPVYNTKQKEVTFAINQDQLPVDGLVNYSADIQNTKDNKSGSDWFFQSEEMPAYTHSFLLTALLSPDYVDVTGDGITDDDMGDAVKFNYSRLQYDGIKFTNYKWRTPFGENKAIFNEGLKTEKQDNKASYTYGEREMWYVHSIESKNMIAVFTLADRNDNQQPGDENGKNAASSSLKKLERIDLYAKAELLAKGVTGPNKARPVKSVIFSYSYQLCPGFILNANAGQGKLTLESVWFTYNGNDNQKRNVYKFSYGNNYSYKRNAQDKWGNYKDAADNPAGMSNVDYPYVGDPYNLDKAKLDAYASAWMLNKILLPSGSQINVEYEADDYGWVQNKRACNMYKIAGYGKSPGDGYNPSNRLFSSPPALGNYRNGDNDYVFIDVPDDIVASTTTGAETEIKQKYLESLKQLILKIWVKLPADYINASGFEPVTVYADIDGYGILPASDQYPANKKRFWIRVGRIETKASPMATATVQLLRDNFPAKAYPGNNVDPTATGFTQIVRAMVGMAQNIANAVSGFDRRARTENLSITTDVSRSFVRLADAKYTKPGGGYRVKRIVIKDGWNKMTSRNQTQPGEPESFYGQEYDYSTDININGVKTKVSSGVSSYETQLGAEENPFKEALNYVQKNPAGPTQAGFIDMPIAETFFPSAMVGYGHVRVRSIHNKSNKNIKSGVGVQESKFFTTKDFPVFSDFTDFDPSSNVRHKPDPILKFLKLDEREMVTLSQGFRVVLNDMNGKTKSQASYPENDLVNPINYTEYFYRIQKTGESSYQLNNDIPAAGKDGIVQTKTIGKDIEVTVDFREHKSVTYSGSLMYNTDNFVVFGFPVSIPVFLKPPMYSENTFRSASVLKVVNQYGVVDSVVQIDKGSMVSTKNLVYDSETGDVLVSRTQNEFNNLIYNTNYPAHWAYTGMEPAYKNIDVEYKNVVFKNGLLESTHVNQDFFESGDEIYVWDENTSGPSNTIGCAQITGVSSLPRSTEFRIWALDIRKDTRNATGTRKLIFIDRYGNPYNSAGAYIRIIRSGKRNMLGASVGSFTSLNYPVKSGRILFNSTDNVINAGAVEFNEKWKGEQAFYVQSGLSTVTRKIPVRTIDATPSAWVVLQQNRKRSSIESWNYEYKIPNSFVNINDNYVLARSWGGRKYDLSARSWLNFNVSTLLPQSKVISARLHLRSHSEPKFKYVSNFHLLPGRASQFHDAVHPHESNYSQMFWNPNPFSINRLAIAWPGNNQSQWKHIFDQGVYYHQPGIDISGTVPSAARNDQSFVNDGNIDGSLNIKNIVENIILDKSRGKDFGASIQIEPRYRGNVSYEGRVCFKPDLARLVIKYYNPSEAYGLPGNPATPPPGQETIDTVFTEWTNTCLSVYTRQFMNPYVHGILGNFRNYRSYVFYESRQQEDPNTPTNIVKDGSLKNFAPYWTFSGNNLVKTTDQRWVWNSEITQVNKKGLEIENHDPLDRYNSAQYGYNNNLPTAVVNNARYREMGFDGFEDYNYKDKLCAGDCKPERESWSRHLKWNEMNGNVIDGTVSHSGTSSLRVAPGSYVQMSQPVSSDAGIIPDVRINLQTTTQSVPRPPTPGNGLTATYYVGLPNSQGVLPAPFSSRIEPRIELWTVNGRNCNYGNLPSWFLKCTDFSVVWTGYIRAEEAGNYKFRFYYNDAVHFFLYDANNQPQQISLVADPNDNQVAYSGNINLNKNEIRRIEVRMFQFGGWGFNNFYWSTPDKPNFVYVPQSNLYSAANMLPVPSSTSYSCTKPEQIQAINNAMIDQFSVVAGQKMVLSAWVKESVSNQPATYTNNQVLVSFNNNGTSLQTFVPTGQIIEGWQRYECVFSIPQGATTMQIRLKNNASANVYFDDVRIHPYNANMKSFVYNPVNLRLMAELDENNYASFYEYDDEGTLTRVKKETREGVKTIKETRSAIQKVVQNID